jgi:hypothetical protein
MLFRTLECYGLLMATLMLVLSSVMVSVLEYECIVVNVLVMCLCSGHCLSI